MRKKVLNLWRIIEGMSRGMLHAEDRAYFEETARRNQIPFDPQRAYVTFRDLTAATDAAGGVLVDTHARDAIDIARTWSLMARAGVQIETDLVGDVAFPETSVKSTAYWLPNEASGASPSDPTLVQRLLTPKMAAAVNRYSRRLSKQANVNQYIGRELQRTIWSLIDAAVIAGASPNGEPVGLVNVPGRQTMSGTTLSGASVNQMAELSCGQNADDERLIFLATPTVRRTLQNRERASGSGFAWDGGQISGHRGYVSTDVPAGTLLVCDPTKLLIGLWGQGFLLEVNPFANFPAGIIEARILVAVDVAVFHPSTIVVATSVT